MIVSNIVRYIIDIPNNIEKITAKIYKIFMTFGKINLFKVKIFFILSLAINIILLIF